MNSKNSKTFDSHILLLSLTDKIDLWRKDKYIALSNRSIYYTWENIKKSYKNNKFKISAPTWNEELELPDGSYSVLDIQDYFQYILKRNGKKPLNPSIKIYTNKITITFNIKSGYYLKNLIPETMKLRGSTKSKLIKDKNGENIPYLQITEIVLIDRNVVSYKSWT